MILRPRRFFEIDSQTEEPEAPPYYKPIAEYLGVGLADRTAREAPIDELDEVARTNLRRLPVPAPPKAPIEPGVWSLEYPVERILLPETFEGLELDGDPVVFVVAIDRFIVVGSNDVTAQERALALADGGLLDFAIVRERDTWKPFLPDNAIGETLRFRILMHLGAAYAAQAELFDDAALQDFMVHATLQLSATRWEKGEIYWLPFTSVIELDDRDGRPPIPANWDDIVALVPDALEQIDDVWPERFRTNRFPPPDVIAGFRKQLEEPRSSRKVVAAVVLAVALIVMYLLFTRR